jgi:hypothetical protein
MLPMRMVFAAVAVCSATAAAQQPVLPIHVIIEAADQAGNPITHAYVAAQPAGGAASGKEAYTDSNGEGAFDLPPGSYAVVVMDGCSMMWTQRIDVPETKDFGISVDAILKPGAVRDCAKVTMAAADMQLLAIPDTPIPLVEMRVLRLPSRRKRRL